MKSSVISVIFNASRDKVILIKRRDVPVWVLPGGGIDAGEAPSDAAIREAFEETGLVVEVCRQIAEYTPLNRLACLTYVYECRRIDGELSTGSETSEIGYFPIDSLPSKLFFLHSEWLMEALANHPDVIRRPLENVTYWNFIKYLCKHPKDTLRFALSRLGIPINS